MILWALEAVVTGMLSELGKWVDSPQSCARMREWVDSPRSHHDNIFDHWSLGLLSASVSNEGSYRWVCLKLNSMTLTHQDFDRIVNDIVKLFQVDVTSNPFVEVIDAQSPQQTDSFSCGWYTIHNAKLFLEWFSKKKGQFHMPSYVCPSYSTDNIYSFRNAMIKVFLADSKKINQHMN
ncbi:hypothetical protein O6H91_02G025300 [Diphasiastrum complanatum]|uniref:Uncharacterized protein n=1 Tax=Diphasiastrum complanatum TaxID=34168 RepID=A0ACC2EDX1_DIPCM|nr:hypothetical protein O6H91_02G025300 [Diphasiastrum complanatum]